MGDRRATFRDLHSGPILVLPNAWDAASARAASEAGFPAVATTSGGVARAHGYPDGEVIPADVMFAAVAEIVAAVDVPVTADIEAGYGLGAGELVDRLRAAGAVGCNLEDQDGPADVHADRVAAVKAADPGLFVNARIDLYVRGRADHDEAIERGRLYAEAGADSVYPIGLVDEDAIAAVVQGVSRPVNIMGRAGCPPVSRLAELGVRRVSVGSELFKVSLNATKDALSRLKAGSGWPGEVPLT